MLPEWLLWRGSLMSFFMHGSLFGVLIFGLPALPELFDRKKLIEFSEDLPLTVEIVSAEEVDRLMDVLAKSAANNRANASGVKVGKLAPLRIANQSDPNSEPSEQPPAAEAASASQSDNREQEAGEIGSNQTRIPTGDLNQLAIENVKKRKAESKLARNKESSEQSKPQTDEQEPKKPIVTDRDTVTDRPQRPERQPKEKSDETPPTQDSTAREAVTEVTATTRQDAIDLQTPLPRATEQKAVERQTETARAVQEADRTPQTGQVEQEARDLQTEDAPEKVLSDTPEKQNVQKARPQAAPQRVIEESLAGQQPPSPEDAPNLGQAAVSPTDRIEPSPAGSEKPESAKQTPTDVNEFLQAVTGRKREIVAEMLVVDRRLLHAIDPSQARAEIPKAAREKTLERLKRAAERGYPQAEFNLATLYLRGEDVEKSFAETEKWLNKAAEKGYAPAQTLLGLMKFTGLGLPQDQAEAAFWWSLASERGSEGAKAGLTLLQPLLKPQEHITAQRLRTRWGSLIVDFSDLAAGNTNRKLLDKELQEAAQQGDIDAVLSLLARGADADSSGDEGRSAVINAAWRGRTQVVELLLNRGANTEFSDEGERTPLIWAAINGHGQTISELLAAGANPNHRDSAGRTALMRAAWNGHLEAVKNLVAGGADVNLRDRNGMSALSYAQREGNTDIVDVLGRRPGQ